MADSTTNLDTISTSQSQKEVTANDLFDAGSPSTSFGRRASTSAGLTWGYYGGICTLDSGSLAQIANGTKTLTNGATNYIELNTAAGTIDLNTSAWTSGKKRLYKVTTSGGAATSYEDWRVGGSGGTPGSGTGDVVGPASATDGAIALFDGTTGKLLKVGGYVGEAVNAQTGTSYTYLNSDAGKLVTHTNASAIAGTLPQAGGGGNFAANWWMDVQNRGVGTLTITPTTSTVDGAATLALTTGQGARVVSDGTNYFTQRGMGSGGGGGGTPGGSDTHVQFNDSSAFGGDADFTWNKTTNVLTLGSVATPTTISSSAGSGAQPGAALNVIPGTGGTGAYAGGAITVQGGTGGSSGGGGNAVVKGGTGTGSTTGGSASLIGGASFAGGVAIITGGAGSGSAGGATQISGGGATTSGNGVGGDVTITGGAGFGNGNGGALNFVSGAAGASGVGFPGAISISIGAFNPGFNYSGAGRTITLTAGAGSITNGVGGALLLNGGAGTGSGQGGNVTLKPGASGSGAAGHVVLNGSGSALATTATGGFTCIPTCAGAPTGVPASVPTGTVPMVYDTTNDHLYVYRGGWKKTTVFA